MSVLLSHQRTLIKQEFQEFFLGNRGGAANRAFIAEVNKPDGEREIPQLKKEFFDLVEEVVTELYPLPKKV